MQIEKDRVVTIHYTLRNDDGTVLDSSEGQEPMTYLHGAGNIIGGLEAALEGRKADDRLTAVIPPAEGYGVRDDALVQVVSRQRFPAGDALAAGMQFRMRTADGARVATVTQIAGDMVTLDLNHPLAGETLHFDVEVKGVREATGDELAHGHVHGPGGHAH